MEAEFARHHADRRPDKRITRFEEKPKDPAVLDSLRLAKESYATHTISPKIASCFSLRWAFTSSSGKSSSSSSENTLTDFGKHIIPNAISTHGVYSYVYQGYWEDIGTIRSFFEANLDATSELPRFNFFDMSAPVFSAQALPARALPRSMARGLTTPSSRTATSSINRILNTASSASAVLLVLAAN